MRPRPTFGPQHHVEDEEVFAFRVDHAEGEFASLSIEIRNPRIGLLAPARKTWAWLSWNNGTAVIPLFFGRLVGVPSDLHQEMVTLAFTARPADYNAQKLALAETLKVAPYLGPDLDRSRPARRPGRGAGGTLAALAHRPRHS